jgi:hypothetical protein
MEFRRRVHSLEGWANLDERVDLGDLVRAVLGAALPAGRD